MQLVSQRLNLLRRSYVESGVTLGNVLWKLSCKGLGRIVKFRANTNLELPQNKIARQVGDGGVTLCNAGKKWLQSLRKVEVDSTFCNDCSNLSRNDFAR